MSQWTQIYVMDQEAHKERLAIMEVELAEVNPDPSYYALANIQSEASECAYNTPFALMCTAAIRGDWEPAKKQCRKEHQRHGEEHARELMRAIQAAVREKLKIA